MLPIPNSAETIRWVELASGAPEYDLSPDGRLVRRAQQGRTWHAVTGSWDLWDDILRRASDILLDRGLRDVGVG